MYLRAFAVWLLVVVLAVANGVVRNTLITPQVGEHAGHVISSITLSIAILLVAWLTISWIGPSGMPEALAVGGFWLLLTVGFEFLAGHYVFGNSWERLLADYNILRGRVWLMVLVVTLLAPFVAAYLRKPPGFSR